MPWSANANYYNFTADSVKRNAPTGSGVYGLYNFRHQLIIAGTTNLRAELLRHVEHTNFRFRRLTPTGFIFETCNADLAELRAQELKWEYATLLPSPAGANLRTWWRAWRDADARAFQRRSEPKPAPVMEKAVPTVVAAPVREKVKKPKEREVSAPELPHSGSFGLIGASFGLIFLAVGLIGLLPHLVNMFGSVVSNAPLAAARQRNVEPVVQAAPVTLPHVASSDMASATAAVDPSQSTVANNVNPANTTAQSTPLAQAAPSANANATGWSVQALATPDKQIANEKIWQLKAKGYEAFFVEVELKGQTWYRVRVGNFPSRQDAEQLRTGLQAKEGLRDAFIAANGPQPETLALNRR